MTRDPPQSGRRPMARDVVIVPGPTPTVPAGAAQPGRRAGSPSATARGHSLLEPTGKVVAWLRVSRRDEDCVLDVDEGYGEDLEARLTRFLLRTDATVAPVTWDGFAVRGPGAADVVPPDDAGRGPGLARGRGHRRARPRTVGACRAGRRRGRRPRDAADRGGGAGDGRRARSVHDPGRDRRGRTVGELHQGLLHRPGAGGPDRLTGWQVAATPDRRCRARPRRRSSGATLVVGGEEAGVVTSASSAPWRDATVALAYVSGPSRSRAMPGPRPTATPRSCAWSGSHDLAGSGGDRRPALP